MEKDTFYRLMSSSDKFNSETLTQLKELVNRYPYFQGARILYLQNLKALSSSDLESEVQHQASLLPNRHHLYKKLNPAKPLQLVAESTETITETKKESKTKTKTKKEPSTEPSFVLLEGSNHADAVTINVEPSNGIADGDILELIDGDFSEQAKNSTDNLIDTFLNNIPKIERPQMPQRGEIIEIEDVSLKSIEEPEELASEPLAQIFIAQGYFEKALAVYEKLCLKYPEKSSYFADQIQKIKEQINSKH